MDLSSLTLPVISVITLVLMGGALLLIMIPAVPVAALEWALAMILGALSGFTRLTPVGAIVVTALMVLGSTSQFWLPIFGMRGEGMSCMGMIAFFVGMAIGTALIPIPFIGTLLGGLIAVILVEYSRIGEMRDALRSGGKALKTVIYGMILEFVFAVGIFLTTLVSVISMWNS
ncbi:MAG: DUF456 domain-containing protein [Anaerolineae bacterium]|nr:DUF456 domain-containing protein [Anaerolineae bacterium]MCA9893546.1 DUF456 domain-containing protein [Anaerolineae bacterium]